ncbi:Uncharacterised protein [Yersinia enterocolitica]|nr:Uncharacterised protein [Yersinia enterocolitica]
MFKVRNDLLYGFLHSIELFKSRVAGDNSVGEQPRHARFECGINHDRLTNSHQQTFSRIGIRTAILLADGEEFLQCELFVLGSLIALAVVIKYVHSDARPV